MAIHPPHTHTCNALWAYPNSLWYPSPTPAVYNYLTPRISWRSCRKGSRGLTRIFHFLPAGGTCVLCSKSPPLICEGGKKEGKKEKLYQTVNQLVNPSGVIPAAVVRWKGGCRHLGLPVAGEGLARSQPLPVNTGTHNSIYKYLNTERLFAELTLWNLLASPGAAQPKKGHKLWLKWWTGIESSDFRTCNQLSFDLNLREKSSN